MMPKIIAHRGASGHAPENTITAFQLALDQGADGFELDVMLSKEGDLVVIHDDTVDRTTNGSGRVRDMTLKELRALDAGDGQKIPTLDEVLVQFGGKCNINIELKNYASIFDALPVKVADLVKNHDIVDTVIISTFNPFNLPRFHRRLPDVALGLLTLPKKADLWLWRLFRYDALHPHFSDVDQKLAADLRAKNKQINVWTVDDPQDIMRLTALQVDSIITNYPQRARECLESMAS